MEDRTPGDVLKLIKDNGIDVIDVRFCDLPGLMQHFSIPAHELTEDVFEDGLGFDGSSIRGFQEIQESDMLLIPDPSTAVIDPFRQHPTLNINCFVRDPLTGESYSRDPRYIIAKAEAYLESTGLADTAYFGPEAEFYIFDSVRFDQNQFSGYYFLDSVEGVWNSGRERELDGGPNLAYKPRYKEGYFPVPPMDQFQDLRSEMMRVLELVGIPIEVQHHEVGTAGQAEIDMRFDKLARMADKLMLYKYVVKNVARAAGYSVTFMPKPLFMDNGSGMHVHQSLWKGGEPLFFDEKGYAGLSDMARWYIGGSAQARAGDPARSPTRRRTRTSDSCPATKRRSTSCTRSATAPRRCASRCTRRARRRSDSSSAAPTRRATRTSRSRRCSWPASTASRTAPSRRPRSTRTSTTSRPTSWRRSRRCRARSTSHSPRSQADHEFLLKGDVFTPDVIDTWIAYKKEHEIDQVQLRPHPWEFYLYYDI